MKSDRRKNYTVNDNVQRHPRDLLNAMVELDLDAHLVQYCGTMGILALYQPSARQSRRAVCAGGAIETQEGTVRSNAGNVLYRANPGSIYHMTKCLDPFALSVLCKERRIAITNLHQGMHAGARSEQAGRHVQLINRWVSTAALSDVLNHFLIQAAMGCEPHPRMAPADARLHPSIGGISVRCINLALKNPPNISVG